MKDYKPTGKRMTRNHIIENIYKLKEIMPIFSVDVQKDDIVLEIDERFDNSYNKWMRDHLGDMDCIFKQVDKKLIINFFENLKKNV